MASYPISNFIDGPKKADDSANARADAYSDISSVYG
jgi:hypothetical protein